MKTLIIGAFAPVLLLVAAMNATRFAITSLFLSGAGMVRFIRLRARRSPAKTPPEEMSGRGESGMNAVNSPDRTDETFNGVKYGRSSGVTIMVASSDKNFTRKLRGSLCACYSLKCFSDGLQAWDCLSGGDADLLVCDTRLEGIGGEELSFWVKTCGKTFPVPVILLDPLADAPSGQRRRHSSADVYLYEPVEPEKVKTEIEILLSNSLSSRRYTLGAVFGDAFLEKRFDSGKDANDRLIAAVKAFILEHISEEGLNVEGIASGMNMSRSKFYALWKSATGGAPQDYLRAVRLEKARELLESGNYPVHIVPEIVGLKDEKHFRTIYKERFGKTPGESVKYGRYLAREREGKISLN